jgi:multiple sugar transport system permease protein
MLWQWLYNGRVGALNGLLFSLGVIDSYRSWLLDPQLSIFMLVFAHVWGNTPLAALVLLAGLQAIPLDLYDAAIVDRAGLLQRFRHITLPWLIHPILIVVILETMIAVKTFDIIYVLTGGGPGNATTVLAWLTYQTAFKFSDLGRGNAYAFLLTLLTMALAAVYLRALYARGDIRQ